MIRFNASSAFRTKSQRLTLYRHSEGTLRCVARRVPGNVCDVIWPPSYALGGDARQLDACHLDVVAEEANNK